MLSVRHAVKTSENLTFRINVGPLSSLESFRLWVGGQLRALGDQFRSGKRPEIEWDLTNLVPRHMNMAALTAFLAVANRIRKFIGYAPPARLAWNPDVLGFLDDISFFGWAKKHDLFALSPNASGGYARRRTNPYSKIFASAYTENIPHRSHLIEWKLWKDNKRDEYTDKLFDLCDPLFDREDDLDLLSAIVGSAADLVLNSHLWGRDTAYIGLQRSPVGITVCVCDGGKGFLSSFDDKDLEDKEGIPPIASDVESLILGSLVNVGGYGLRRTIGEVLDRGGWIVLCSGGAELRWGVSSWQKATEMLRLENKPWVTMPDSTRILRQVKGRDTHEDRGAGFYRTQNYRMFGAYVSFEISFGGKAH